MKKMLSILGTISLVGTSTTSLVSCGEEPKCENKIIGNLKEICSSDRPFHNDDDKWYFVIVKGDSPEWNIIKFQNNNKTKTIYSSNDYEVDLAKGSNNYSGLVIFIKKDDKKFPYTWGQDKGKYFKNVYQWLGDNEPTNNDIPKIDDNGNIIV
ncbi:MAG: lipoprotein [Spiroplasma sp. hy2]|uniref:lipoprotein n=1 Tax=Spiroplasma sp. hy2 TaxID=2490850 RepID=UPI003844AED6